MINLGGLVILSGLGQVDRGSRSGVKPGSRGVGGYGRKVAVDNYSGKRGIDVVNYIFPFASYQLSIRIKRRGSRD